MPKTATINVKTDKELKDKVENIFSKLGISPSDAINMFYSQVLLSNGLPFEVPLEPSKNLANSIKELEEGKVTRYKSTLEMMKDLKL